MGVGSQNDLELNPTSVNYLLGNLGHPTLSGPSSQK